MIVGRKSRFFVIKDSPRRMIISNKKRSERNMDFYSEKRQKHFMWLRDNRVHYSPPSQSPPESRKEVKELRFEPTFGCRG